MAVVAMIIGGMLSMALAVFHLRLPRLLRWPQSLEGLSAGQRKVIVTLNAALVMLFLIFGVVTLVYAQEMALGTGLAGGFTVALALFWLWRLVWQMVVFRPGPEASSRSKTMFAWLTASFVVLVVAYALPMVLNLFG